MKPVKQNGFTLVELMIVVAVIGILASIALPAYKEYVVRGHRAAAQAEMMGIANRQQQLFLSNRAFSAMNATACKASLPAEVSGRYGCTVTVGTGTVPTYTITFTPVAGGAQADDGELTLNSDGVKAPAEKWQ
ncbi:MAG: type IV pilin protein [Betaproteobacteria bacterium]|nr:MAG: type IV pilin protein [Betaproteobacteria bacterium]